MKLLRKTQVQQQESMNVLLLEGQETKHLKCDREIDAKTALKLEFE